MHGGVYGVAMEPVCCVYVQYFTNIKLFKQIEFMKLPGLSDLPDTLRILYGQKNHSEAHHHS